MLYSIEWEIDSESDPVTVGEGKLSNELPLWQVTGGFNAWLNPEAPSIQLGATSLSLMQNLMEKNLDAGGTSSTAAVEANAIMSALVKVASIESSDSKWGYSIRDSFMPSFSSSRQMHDAFGSLELGGALLKPMLSVNTK